MEADHASASFRFLKAFGLLVVGLGLLILHRHVAKLTGTGTAAPMSRTRDLLRSSAKKAANGVEGGSQLRKRRSHKA